jgi:2-methylcitrate dehydratase PrpD
LLQTGHFQECARQDSNLRPSDSSAATGHPRKPMSRERLEAKFFECAELAISVEQARRAADMIWHLEKLERVGDLHRILSG